MEEALRIDQKMGTNYWEEALPMEAMNIQVACKVKEGVMPDDIETGKVPDMINQIQEYQRSHGF